MAIVMGAGLCVRVRKKMVSFFVFFFELFFFFGMSKSGCNLKLWRDAGVRQVSASRVMNCGLALQFADCTSPVSSFFLFVRAARQDLSSATHATVPRPIKKKKKRRRPAGWCFFFFFLPAGVRFIPGLVYVWFWFLSEWTVSVEVLTWKHKLQFTKSMYYMAVFTSNHFHSSHLASEWSWSMTILNGLVWYAH